MTRAREENQSGSSATTRGLLTAIFLRCGKLTYGVVYEFGQYVTVARVADDGRNC